MKSKKVTVLLISLTLLVSMTLPATVVVSADQAADSGETPLLSEDEGKDTSPEGAGDPDSPGANQNEDQGGDPSGSSGTDQGGDPSGSSGTDQGGDPSGSSGTDQGGDSSVPAGADQGGDSSGLNQSGDPSQPEGTESTGEQNTCTCGVAQGEEHKEGCPLYVAPDVIPTEPAKECNCGNEDGPHAETCPLYVAPEGPEEEEEQAESDGASLTVSVQVSGEDQRNAVLNLTGPGGYCKRIVVHGSASVTLSGLEAGEYTVSCGTDSQSVTLGDGESGSLDITVARSSHGWLTGEAYQVFTFDN